MAIYYLDIDDEITSAAARIRDSSDSRIALVLSGGSRVATSRINFRLLSREAKKRSKRLAIIAADPSIQSVARSAELPVYASVGEYERSEAAMAGGPGGRHPDAVKDALDELALTVAPGIAAAASAMPAPKGGVVRVQNGRAVGEPMARRKGVPRAVVGGVAVLVVAAIAAAGFFFYPSANVVLTLRQEAIGPITMSVTVDPSVSAVNDQTGTVPGVSKAFPLKASGTFEATGQAIIETAAAGTVTFTSYNTYLAVPVLSGTQVSTSSNVAFVTTTTVTVPRATISGTSISPGTANVGVTAVAKGLSGNVKAGTIIYLPNQLASALVPTSGTHPVTNKAATTGGTHTVSAQIQQSDLDAAMGTLHTQMDTNFQAAMKAPGAISSGSTLFAESAQLGASTCTPDPTGLAGQQVTTFQLDCVATGTAIVADMTAVRDLATRRISGHVTEGYSLVNGSVTTKAGTAVVHGTTLVVPMTVQAGQVRTVDVDKLRAGIQGKSLTDAKTFLSQYGQAQITLSPDWMSTVPSFDFRIDIKVVDGSAQPGSSSTGLPSGTGPKSSSATGVPSATPSPPTPTGTPSDTSSPGDTSAPTDTPAPTDTSSPSPSPS